MGNENNQDIGNEPGEMGDYLDVIDLGTGRTALELHLGFDHTCMTLDDDSLKCFGGGGEGRLGSEALKH